MAVASLVRDRPLWDPMCSGGEVIELVNTISGSNGIVGTTACVWWQFTGSFLWLARRLSQCPRRYRMLRDHSDPSATFRRSDGRFSPGHVHGAHCARG